MNHLIKLLLFFVLLSCLTDLGLAESPKHASLTVPDDSYDFGFIPIDYRVSHTFYLKNSGTELLTIEKVVNNCDCTTSQIRSKEIPPGDSTELTLIFHTINYYGRTTRTVTIFSNDPEKPEYDVSYTAELGLLPKLYKTNPISLIILPSASRKTISLLNLSDDDIEFGVEYQDKMYFSVDKTVGQINARDSVVITVTPLANIPPGTFYNNFTVSYMAGDDIRLTVPVKIIKY